MRANPAKVLRKLSELAPVPASDPTSDAALLERYIGQRDEAAFSVLVARHAAMVLRLCRRTLGDHPDAEDACQATFLVLARKAGAIRRPEHLAAWLHGTAYRVARKAQARRRPAESAVPAAEPADPRPDPLTRITARELLVALDQELARLPETYRLPLILCYLEGRTQEEAARQLGWSAGSIKGRLERGRARLHARLARRGLALSAALLALDAVHGSAAAMPAAPLATVVRAALRFAAGVGSDASSGAIPLAEGVLKAMFVNKVIIATVLLLVVVVTAGTGSFLFRGEAAEERGGPVGAAPTPPPAPQAKETADKNPASDQELLQGKWIGVAAEANGRNTLGIAPRDQGKLDEAIAAYRKAIELNPKNDIAYTNLGIALAENGRLDEAIAEYRRAIELNPKDDIAYTNLGIALAEMGRLDEAIAEYRMAVALDRNHVTAHNLLGNALRRQGKLDAAAAEYRKAIELNPQDPRARTNLGIALEAMRRLDEAIAEYRKAIALNPKGALAHYHLGVALAEKGLLDEAIAAYRTAVALDRNDAAAHRMLGNALRRKGMLDEAAAEHRKAIDLEPKGPKAHTTLGTALNPVKQGFQLTIDGNRFTMGQENALHFPHGTFTLDASRQPKAIDLTQKYGLPGERAVLRHGIYALDGATLKLCLAVPGGKRPTDFTAAVGSEREMFVFKRPGAAKPQQECFATREGNTITLHPENATFRVTDVMLNWFNSFKNNLHLSRAELAKVENGAGDWDKEYGLVCNAALPFSRCCAHVGDEGWGKDAVSFADLQVRVYVLDQPLDEVLRRIEERAAAKVKDITKEAPKTTRDDDAAWKRRSFAYKRWYGDYGGGATVDFRARQFDGHTVVFAFMYTDYTNQQAKVQAMLQSFTWGAKKSPDRNTNPR